MEDIIDIIVTETTNLITITSSGSDEVIDVNIIDNREDIVLNVTPSVVEININSLTSNFGVSWGQITGTLSNQTDLNTALGLKADLVGGKVPSSQLPSYVDDVVEVANYAALPATGETGKIYITLDTNFMYRWSGSTYIEIKDSSAVWGAITGTLSSQTDLQNALNAKFDDPTGDATQYIDGTGALQTFPVLASADKLILVVRNTSGATITKGTVVYINGASGNKPTIAKALATGDATSAQTLGLVQTNITNNSNGNVVLVGSVIDLDTSSFTEGQQLYLSGVTAGAYTATKTLAPTHLVYVGVIARAHPTQGVIEVKIQNGYELDEIHDVSIVSKANNDGLFYESSTSLWKNKSIATVLGYTPANGANYLALAGGTMTGALNGTSISLSSSITASALFVTGMTAGSGAIYHTGSRLTFANYNASGTLHFEVNGGVGALTLNSDKSATFESSVSATSLIKSGGTSAQFLKADGSVDSSTYVKGSGTATYLASWSSTANTLTDSFISFASNITTVEGMGLTTLNGLNILGNYGAGGGGQKIRSFDETTGNAYIDFANTGGRFYLGVNRSTSGGLMTNATAYATVLTTGLGTTNLEFGTNATKRMTIDGTTGEVTLTSALSGTSASFSSTLTATKGTFNGTTSEPIRIERIVSGTTVGRYSLAINTAGNFSLYDAIADSDRLTIVQSTGAATFSSSVTATGIAYISGNSNTGPIPYLQLTDNYGSAGRNWAIMNGYENYGTFSIKVSSAIGGNPTTGTPVFNITQGGNVGINTTAPSTKLNVVETDEVVAIQINDSTTNQKLMISNTSITVGRSSGSNGNLKIGTINQTWGANGGNLIFDTVGFERMRITSSGSLLTFNTVDDVYDSNTSGNVKAFWSNQFSTPSGTAKTLLGAAGATSSILGFGALNASSKYIITSGVYGLTTSTTAGAETGVLAFYTKPSDGVMSANERMRITSAGGVLIGKTTSAGTTYGLEIKSPSGDYLMHFTSSNGSYSSDSYQSGNDGTLHFRNGSCDVYLPRTAGTWVGNSDSTIKENINLIDNSLSKVMQLNGYTYNLIDDKDNLRAGLLAQEVEAVLPQAVHTTFSKNYNKNIKGVEYDVLIPLLVNSIKELKAELDTLKNK